MYLYYSFTPGYFPYGPQTNVRMKTVLHGGWVQCFSEPYNQYMSSDINRVQNTLCTKEKVMLACRRKNSEMISLLSWAPRDDVFYDTGPSWTRTHSAHGSEWYFEGSNREQNGYYGAWGFAFKGDTIYRSSYCDYYTSGSNDKRLCLNTYSSASSNNRCGANIVGSSSSWEKLVFHSGDSYTGKEPIV